MSDQCTANGVPILTSIKERRESIMANTPGVIVIDPNPDAKAYPHPFYALQSMQEVMENRVTIESLAAQYGLETDFVKAVVWMESTHGWYDRFDPKNKTIRPMNVHDTLWGQLGIDRKTLQDRTRNVAAGVYILSQIWDRTNDPTVEKVATLYNELGATKVNGYGKTIEYYRVHRPWLRSSANMFRPPCQACHQR